MSQWRDKHSIKLSFVAVVVFYTLISLFVVFFHNHNEDPQKFHDNCPACRWENQSQDTHLSVTVSQIFATPPILLATNYIYIGESDLLPQLLHKGYPTRSPPLAFLYR